MIHTFTLLLAYTHDTYTLDTLLIIIRLIYIIATIIETLAIDYILFIRYKVAFPPSQRQGAPPLRALDIDALTLYTLLTPAYGYEHRRLIRCHYVASYG